MQAYFRIPDDICRLYLIRIGKNYCCSNGSLVDKIICDLNKDPDSPHLHTFSSKQHHCFQCKDVLGDGEFCQRCTCKSCGKGAHIGYNYPPKVPVISNPEPCKTQTINELPQTLPSFHPACYSEDESPVDDSPNLFNPPPQPPKYSYEFCGNDAYYGHDCPPQVPFTYDPEPKRRWRKKSKLRKSKRLKPDIGRFPFAMMMTRTDDKSFFDEDISKKIYSNPLFDEEIISIKIDPHHFNAKFDLIESLLNLDSLIISSSSKIDYLLDEFTGELIFLKSIPSVIDKVDFDPEKEIRLIEKSLYDNSSLRPPKEFNSKNSDAIIKSFSPSSIRIEDSDPFME
uniref:Uncharacterized protein n=1 Tax=Tanacetum cinerariifolium TaxID=118510 RepID=A0A6L2JVF4_TANCI|nr:hypothetical protein [Tanacetum cinerariifolium]